MKLRPKINLRVVFACVMLCFFAMFISANKKSIAKEPANLSKAKNQIKKYYTSNQFQKDFNAKILLAKKDLKKTLSNKHPQSLAAVFDIDDTLLSSYKCNNDINFGYSEKHFIKCARNNNFSAIKPSVNFYKYLRSLGIKTFIVTGRRVKDRALAIQNLNHIGIKKWDGLFLKPNNYNNKSAVNYKASIRKKLTQKGNFILFSI